ncbi:MAG TPA: hypothetical protein VM513_35945 [Kofleriaceae bacterium]|nr:hypothetical protein [Kofleriaceae bacterium]
MLPVEAACVSRSPCSSSQLASCTDDGDCAPDYMCLTDAQGANGICQEGCDAQNPCSNGHTCYGWSPPMIIGGVTFGACR